MLKKLLNPFFIISLIIFIAIIFALPHTTYPIPFQLGIESGTSGLDAKITLIIASFFPLMIELFFALFPDVTKDDFWSVFSDFMGKAIKNFLIILISTSNLNGILKGFNINLVSNNPRSLFLGIILLISSNYIANINYLSKLGINIIPTTNNSFIWKRFHLLISYLFILIGMLLIIINFTNLVLLINILPIIVFISLLTLYLYSYRLIKKN